MRSLKELLTKVKKGNPKRCIVAVAQDKTTLIALRDAREEGIIKGVLFGDKLKIEKTAQDLNIFLKDFEIVDEPSEEEAVRSAVKTTAEEGDFLLKGKTSTALFLKTVLDKNLGLRTDRILSHAAILEPGLYHKILMLTDGGLNIRPDFKKKLDIIENGVELARKLGIEKPKVALLASSELVNPDMPETVEWEKITELWKEREDAIVEGPLALDLAVSKEACRIKGIESRVNGDVDILVVADVATGNIFAKGVQYLGGAEICGTVLGAKRPVAMLSRADSVKTKLYSMALACIQ